MGGTSEIFCSQGSRRETSSEFLWGRDPDVVPGLVLNDLFDFAVNFFKRVSLYDGCKIFSKLLLKFHGFVKDLVGLFICLSPVHLHEGFNGFRFDENGNGIKLCLSQPLDSIARHIQDAVLPPLCHRPHGLDAGAIEIVIELPSLYELVVLDVFLHLLPGHHKVVILAVHLVLTPRPGGVGHAGTKLVREFRDEVVVNSVLGWAQDDHWPGIVNFLPRHWLVRQDGVLLSFGTALAVTGV